MSRLLELATRLVAVGLVPQARLRRLQVHESYWILRDRGVAPETAVELVAESFELSPETVQTYSRRRDAYEKAENPRDESPPQS